VTVLPVAAIVLPSKIVQRCKALDDHGVRAGLICEDQANAAHARPMAGAVDAVPVEGELAPQERDEIGRDDATYHVIPT
jgi:hypothetical protein